MSKLLSARGGFLAALISLLLVAFTLAFAPVTQAEEVIGTGSVAGVVTTTSGTPVPDVEVNLSGDEETGYEFASSFTDADGTFETGPMVPGTYDYSVDTSGGFASGTVEVGDGAPTELNLVLTEFGSVFGVVRDASGDPVQSYRIQFEGAGGEGPYGSGTTDDSGHYVVEGLAPGAYEYFVGGENAGTIELGDGEAIELDIDLASSYARLSGTVSDSNGDPVGPFLLHLSDDELNSYAEIEVDDSGEFFMSTLRAGNYDWMVHYGPIPPLLAEGTFTASGEPGQLDIELPVVFGSISGTIIDAEGNPVEGGRLDFEGVDVDTVRPGDEVRYHQVLTDGSIELANVLPGTYEVTYSDYFGEGPEGFLTATVVVASGEVTTVAYQLSDEYATLEGFVRDSSGAPLAGHSVSVVDDDYTVDQRLEADADGHFSVQLPPGTYRIDADSSSGDKAAWRRSVQHEVTLAPGEIKSLELVAYLDSGLSGTWPGSNDFNGLAPSPQVVDTETGETVPYGAGEIHSEESRWIADHLLPGSYAVSFGRGSGYTTISQQFSGGSRTLADAETITLDEDEDVTGIDPTLESGTFSGSVESDAGVPVQASQVAAYTDDESLFTRSGIPEADGNFTVPGLAEGDYKIAVWFRTETVFDDETGEETDIVPPEGIEPGEYFYTGTVDGVSYLSRDRADAVPVTSTVPGDVDLGRLVVGEAPEPDPDPTETASPDPDPTETASPDPDPTETASPDPDPTETASPDPDPTETASPDPDPTETASPDPDPTETASPDPDPTETPEPVASNVATELSNTTPKAGANHIRVTSHVSAQGETATGNVAMYVNDRLVRIIPLEDGVATSVIGPFSTVGTHTVTVAYLGDDQVAPSQSEDDFTVVKADTEITTKVSPGTIRSGRTTPQVTVTVETWRQTVNGTVTVRIPGFSRTVWLRNGVAQVDLPTGYALGDRDLTVHYNGAAKFNESTLRMSYTIVR